MKKTKIDWCDCTINPVVGCKNGCKYCYAKKINDRFHFVKDWNEPEFFPDKLYQLKSKKPKSVFIDSMSDIGCWEYEWLESVMVAMQNFCKNTYIALTKTDTNKLFEKIFTIIKERHLIFTNFYIGKSITTNKQAEEYIKTAKIKCDFLSIEPILEPITAHISNYTRQVIIGAETGNRKGKVIPKKEWIDDIVKACDKANVRVFMKESLRSIMGADFRQDKLIWEN